jgi:hypothetical protein
VRLEGKVVAIGLALVLLSPMLVMSSTAGFPSGFKPRSISSHKVVPTEVLMVAAVVAAVVVVVAHMVRIRTEKKEKTR